MAFVKFTLSTNYVGTTVVEVYDIPDEVVFKDGDTFDKDLLDEIGYSLAKDNAEMYGIEAEDDGCEPEDPFSFNYEILNGTVEEIEEDYGCILSL